MTPLTLPTQITLESRVTAGSGVPVWTYNDYWGTYVCVFDLPDPHDDLLIRAASTVETQPFAHPGRAGTSRAGRSSRAAGRGRTAARVPAADDADHGDTRDLGGRDRRVLRPASPDEAAAAIASRVSEHVTYMPGATGVRTNAQEAWDKGQGVCQDMAHVDGRADARGRPARPLRLRLPAPRHRRRSPAAPRSASATPGSSTGRARGPRSTRPAARRSASGTWSSPAAATTPTSRRSRASTAARPTATWRSPSRSPASPEPSRR